MNPQAEVARYVKERGYWDGLEPDALVCRHVAKLVEELAEVSEELYHTIIAEDIKGNWWFTAYLAGRQARLEFDNLDAWPRYKILSKERMAAELADLQVVLFSMSEVLGIDVIEMAREKARADVERGVR